MDDLAKAVALARKDLARRETLVRILKEERAGVDELELLLKRRSQGSGYLRARLDRGRNREAR